MAYQSADMAEKLADKMAGRNDIATNNADPVRQMQGQGSMQRGQKEEVMPESAHRPMDYNFETADKSSQSGGSNVLSKIGRALSTSSDLSAYDESQARLEDQDLKLRQDAMIDDTLFGKRALDTGNTAMFLDRLKKRIDAGIGLGHDMTESVGLYNLAQTDMKAAKTVLDNTYLNLVDRSLVQGIERTVPLTEFQKETLKVEENDQRFKESQLEETKRQNNKLSDADKTRNEKRQTLAKDYETYKLVSRDLKNIYSNVSTAFETGIGTGSLPAFTDESRMFETTGQQMLALMKDVFRKAGEGTFTEGDQKVLTDMLPNRTMNAQEFDVAIRRLDAIVAMKTSNGNLTMDEILANLDAQDQQRRNTNNSNYVAPPVRNPATQEAIRKAGYGSSKIDMLVNKHSSSGAQ